MITRFAVPFLILAVIFLPLPLVLSGVVFCILLAARPRGEPCLDRAYVPFPSWPTLLRSPPR